MRALSQAGSRQSGNERKPGARPPLDRLSIQSELNRELQLMLQLDSIDPQQSFIDMGADSIMLAEAIAMIESRYDMTIKISQLFESQSTLESLAAYISEHSGHIDNDIDSDSSAAAGTKTQASHADTVPSLSHELIALQDLIDLFDDQLNLVANTIDRQNQALRQRLNEGQSN